MEHGLDKLWARARDAAYRAGLLRFWRWWTSELAPLVPAAPRSEIQRRRTRPILEFSEGQAILWRPELADDATRLAEVARIPLSGDAAQVASAGRAAISELASAAKGMSGPPRIAVALAPRQVLRKEIVLPAAIEENLHRTLAYDLDRHTPFRPEQLYFDATVVARDLAKRTIRVQWVAALRNVVDAARKQAEDWGASVVAVVPGPAAIGRLRLNLLPESERPPLMLWRRWQVWAPAALVAVIALAVVLVPLVQKREYTIALMRQTGEAKDQAETADSESAVSAWSFASPVCRINAMVYSRFCTSGTSTTASAITATSAAGAQTCQRRQSMSGGRSLSGSRLSRRRPMAAGPGMTATTLAPHSSACLRPASTTLRRAATHSTRIVRLARSRETTVASK